MVIRALYANFHIKDPLCSAVKMKNPMDSITPKTNILNAKKHEP